MLTYKNTEFEWNLLKGQSIIFNLLHKINTSNLGHMGNTDAQTPAQ